MTVIACLTLVAIALQAGASRRALHVVLIAVPILLQVYLVTRLRLMRHCECRTQ